MILDNRQVPDIIVSRDGTNQNNNNNNNNNNARHGSANSGSPKHGGGKNGNHGSPRHVNFDSPKHVNYGSNAGPRQGSLGGSNGNGSPRHVGYGSPRHAGYSGPRHRNGNELPDSPCHNPVSGYNNNGSPRHVNRNGGCGYSHGNPASPRHSSSLSHDGNGNGSPRHHMNINCSNHGSPRHVIRNGSISPRFIQRVYSFDHGHGSPKHMAAVRTGSCDDSSLPPGHYHHHQRPVMTHHLQQKVQNHQHQQQQQKHSNHNHPQKHHYHHQQLAQQQQYQEQERASRTPSKIPVHVQERSSRDRANSLDRTTKEDRSSSPKRSQLRKGRGVLASTPIRRSSELDLKNTDFKTVIKEYSQLSPKRVNLRNKNQNLFKYGSCRIEVKDKPTNAWHPWKKLAETKWHSSEAECDKLNTHSAKWNTQNRDYSGEQDEWNSGKDMWNIECDKSEEENDQVFLPDDPEEYMDDDHMKKQKDKRSTSSSCSNSNSSCSIGSSSSRHGRRESWPILNGNLMVAPREAERGPSPQSRHYKEILRKDSLGINPKYFASSQSGSETGSCSPRHGSRCPSPRYVNRCGSPRNGVNRCASPRNGNFISSPRKGSIGSVCSVDSRKSDFDKETDWDSGVESVTSKMVLIKCKDANYLTRIYLDKEGIHALKVVGRVGAGGSAAAEHVMTEGQSGAAPGQLSSNQHAAHDDVTRGCGDVTARDNQSDNTASLISQATDIEFEHETADYQWLLDYDLPCARYRESYSREVGSASICSGRDGSGRVSVLEPSQGQLQDLSYETLARNLDANLAEIDMDDFRSEDIHNILTLPTMCGEFQSAEDGEMFASVSGSMMDRYELESSMSPHTSSHCDREEEGEEDEDNVEDRKEVDEVEEEEYSGVSGELSLYQSGPLFSPLKEPPPLANTTFSVDSLDCDSLHDDLILTCQANKDNYTIAFEGSFIHYSEDSDYHEAAESESSACSHWSAAERLEGRCAAPSMTHSDQPYTTWSRVSRRSSRTPEVPSRATQPNPSGSQLETPKLDAQAQPSSKSNSMPNLMRRSLMRRSLEAAAGCVKVYDLQNSMRSSQSSRAVANEANNFSLVKLFMRQKSLSKEAVSLSSSISQEGACCSSSDNQSNVHDSSDWPMNSQSENDMDGSASPVPPPVLMRQNGVIYHDRGFRRRTSSLGAPEITPRTNTTGNQDFNTQDTAGDAALTSGNAQQEGLLNNNNNIITAANLLDNTVQFSNNMDNVTSFEDSLKETSPCSKPPVTSPIREEPEGMDISMDSRGESKVLLDQSEKETKMHDVLRLRDNKLNAEKNNMTPVKSLSKDVGNKNINKNAFNIRVDDRKRSQSPGTPKKGNNRRESSNASTRRRQDSGNSSSGYMSNRGSTEKIRRPSDSEQAPQQKPRPKPRVLKQMSDQCLQTSSLKVSAMVNTSFDLDKKEVYIYYPNYALPDLGFLKDKKYNVDARVFLVPQHYISRPEEVRKARESRSRRPFSCGDMEKLRKHGFGHIKDWDSLNFLLPKELKEMLLDETDCMETTKPSFCQSPKPSRRPVSCDYTPQRYANDMKSSSSSLNSTQPSSGFRGSSTMLNDSEVESGGLDQKYLYKYDSGITDSGEGVDKPPPLPKRSISLPVDERQGPEDSDTPPPRPPLPRGILRKSTSLKEDPSKGASGHNKRYSAIDPGRGNMREDLLKRRSLQEPMEYMAQRAARETIPEVLQANTEAEKDKEISTSPLSPMGCSCVSSQCTGFCGKGLQKKNLLRVSELPDISSHEELTEEDLLRIRSQVSTLLVTRGNVGPILADVNNPCDLCPKKSVSFAEKKGQNPDAAAATQGAGSELTDDETRPVVYDAHDKKTLVLSVRSAVEKLVTHFSSASSQTEKVRLGTSSVTPIVAQIALEKLCPAIYALLSDGLHPSLQSLFGKINNSVWRVIEVTSQMSPSTKALSDLVLTLNSEDCLSEGPIKFNAFIFGLLNIRSLDSWLSYIRTRESVIQKHYHPEAFLYLSNTATKTLYDDLLLALRPLTILPFNLDLLHEYKALHASLQKMEERLLLHTSSKESPGERPPSVLDHLLASKETKEFKNAAQQDRVKALMRVLTSPDLDENELLNSTSEQCRERSRSPRPRSCYEHVANEETNPTLKKRWSGVQLGSRLLTAIDKLMLEEATGTSSEDYTDSIDNPKNNRPVYSRQSEHTEDEVPSDLRISDISSRDGDVSERSASEKDTENEKGSRACANTEEDEEPEGVRFRRLQLKWEQMAGPEKRSKMPLVQQQQQPQPQPQPQPPPPEKALSPSSGTRSRIPRPVSMTSPVRPFKPFDPSKEKTSPQVKQPPKPIAVIPKELPKPAPRRSLKDKATTPNNTNDEQANARPPSVRSRLAPRPSSVNSNANTVRASSVPGRVPSGDKGNNSGRYDGQRRYGGQQRSASHGRRVAPGDMPKLVQTLHHRLATDNGHLSFNRGDILTLVVEVDDRYLLCCHNDRKGLVPRASVIVYEQ